MAKEMLVLTDRSCPYCEVVKEHLALKKNIKFVGLNDKESKLFFKNGSVPIPIAYKDGEFCLFNIKDDKLLLNCNGKIKNLE